MREGAFRGTAFAVCLPSWARTTFVGRAGLTLSLVLLCGTAAQAKVWNVAARPGGAAALEGALAQARDGDVVRLSAGRFDLARTERLATAGVTLEGAGPDRTVLSFKAKPQASDLDADGALIAAADRLTVRGLSIVDNSGPALTGRGLNQLTLSRVAVRQSLGRRPNGPGMGIRIFASRDVLFDGIDVRHATVSGLQISTSENIIVRNSRFEDNSVGLEVENDYFIDVRDNVMTGNATGVMFLDMPSYPHIGGHAIRAFRNQIVDNDALSSVGGIAGTARRGTGVLVMGGETNIHLFENQIGGNGHANVLIIALPWQIDNPAYDAGPNDIVVRDNVFGRTSYAPQDGLAALAAQGEPLADVVWDGATSFVVGAQVKTTAPLRLTMERNLRVDARPVGFLSMGHTMANGGSTIATPSRTPLQPAKDAEPPPVKLPQEY